MQAIQLMAPQSAVQKGRRVHEPPGSCSIHETAAARVAGEKWRGRFRFSYADGNLID
jgi:hypothetical protein